MKTRISFGFAKGLALAISALFCTGMSGGGLYDFDGDGHVDMSDCAPENPAIFPGATEILNDGIDSDCDGQDNFLEDLDGDGSANPFDCRPLDPTVHPGASEVSSDGVDSNCDGLD